MIIAANRSMLDSGNELERIVAMSVLLMAAKSGEPVDVTSYYILISG